MPYRHIAIAAHGPVEVMSLSRPDALNALSPDMAAEITDYLDSLHRRTEVRVLILRGEGRAFCAGLDIEGWPVPEGASMVMHMHGLQKAIGDIMRRLRSCPQPVIALGHGAACGAGLSLMLAADVRYGAPDLRMNAAYVRIGLGGCDVGSSYFLPRLVGSGIAAEMILTGRFVEAERAERIGLVNAIVPQEDLLATGLSLAQEMIAHTPYGLRLSKEALNINLDAPSLEAAMMLEDRQQVMLSATLDHSEAMQAFLEKRPPRYSGR